MDSGQKLNRLEKKVWERIIYPNIIIKMKRKKKMKKKKKEKTVYE